MAGIISGVGAPKTNPKNLFEQQTQICKQGAELLRISSRFQQKIYQPVGIKRKQQKKLAESQLVNPQGD